MSSAIVSMADSLAEFPERCPEFSMLRNFPVPIRKCIVEVAIFFYLEFAQIPL